MRVRTADEDDEGRRETVRENARQRMPLQASTLTRRNKLFIATCSTLTPYGIGLFGPRCCPGPADTRRRPSPISIVSSFPGLLLSTACVYCIVCALRAHALTVVFVTGRGRPFSSRAVPRRPRRTDRLFFITYPDHTYRSAALLLTTERHAQCARDA